MSRRGSTSCSGPSARATNLSGKVTALHRAAPAAPHSNDAASKRSHRRYRQDDLDVAVALLNDSASTPADGIQLGTKTDA